MRHCRAPTFVLTLSSWFSSNTLVFELHFFVYLSARLLRLSAVNTWSCWLSSCPLGRTLFVFVGHYITTGSHKSTSVPHTLANPFEIHTHAQQWCCLSSMSCSKHSVFLLSRTEEQFSVTLDLYPSMCLHTVYLYVWAVTLFIALSVSAYTHNGRKTGTT